MSTKGKQAFRSGSQTAYGELKDLEIKQDQEERADDQVKLDKEQDQTNAKYASLKGHPGWELIKKDFEKAIANYRSGAALAAAALDPEIDDSELGKLTRTSLFVADELERKLLTVESAAIALEEDNAGRSKRRRS